MKYKLRENGFKNLPLDLIIVLRNAVLFMEKLTKHFVCGLFPFALEASNSQPNKEYS